MNRHLPALLLGALAACTSPTDTQTVTGRIQSSGFSGSVLGARAVSGDTVVASSNIDSAGAFSLDIPKGTGYRLEIVTTTGAQPLVAGTNAGVLVAMSFDVCAPVAPFDLGSVVQGDSWPGPGHDGGCGCPNPDANGNCPPPCDPTTDPSCQPPPPPGCDPTTDPNCLPCPDPNADGTCPPPCDPTTDPNCLPPPPPSCDPSDPNCVPPPPPPPCDPSTDANCGCPNPAPDGTCPPPCDPSDPNCVPPPPPSCDDPSTCPPPPGQPCDSDGNCDPGQCAVPDQQLPSFGCGGV